MKRKLIMNVGVMKDYKLRDLRASHTWKDSFVYYESMKRKLDSLFMMNQLEMNKVKLLIIDIQN
jgi:hypothetical protein